MQNNKSSLCSEDTGKRLTSDGYDPELLFVQCGKCGSPILWSKGKATRVLDNAGIDPIELDTSCMLISDGCPICSKEKHHAIQVYRTESPDRAMRPRIQAGHA